MNYWAILVATIAAYLIGWAWYSALFGKIWMKLTKLKPTKDGMGATMFLGFIATLITALVLAIVMQAAGMNTPILGLIAGALLWLGFVAPYMFNRVLYEKAPMGLFLINASYALVSLLVMGLIIGVW